MQLAPFILWKFLQMPGGLYAKWDANARKAVWFYSQERDFIFQEPRQDVVFYEEHDRSRFRSLVFRLGSLGDDEGRGELCGFFEFATSEGAARRYAVHSSFRPEHGVGLWIAITSLDEHDGVTKQEP